MYAAYGIYNAENIFKMCKTTYIYIVTKSTRHCIVYISNFTQL